MSGNNLKNVIAPYKTVFSNWINKNDICKTPDKKNKLFWEMLQCMVDGELQLSDFEYMVSICSKEDIQIKEGNIWEYLKSYFNNIQLTFLKDIYNICPRGLCSSPNADCGKGELFYRFIRPNSRQPKKGDIIENKEITELKGSEVRLMADKSGKKYGEDTKKVFQGSGIIGNRPKSGGLKGTIQYEIEKPQYEEHYGKQFCEDIPKSKKLIEQYLYIHDLTYSEDDIEKMFENGKWNQSVLQRIWLKKMFPLTLNGADKMIIFGDGTNVKILRNVDDLCKISIYADYFRINQSSPVGFYIK
jgi:hypothetical protein